MINLSNNLNMWKWAIGRGCMCSALAWHKEEAEMNGSLFPVHKVNVSDSRVLKGRQIHDVQENC